MAAAAISRAPPATAPVPQPPHQTHTQSNIHDHHVLQLHHNAYSISSARSDRGHVRPSTLPSHAYDQILPAKPQAAAQRPESARFSAGGSPVPLTEHNVAILERQQGTPASLSIASPRQQSLRKHSNRTKTRNGDGSSHDSRHSHEHKSGLASSARQHSETPRQLPVVDLEKQAHLKNDWSSGEHYYSTYSEDDLEASTPEARSHNLQALLHLCATAPFLSLCITLYTLVILIFTSFASVIHLCIPGRPSFRDYTTSFLVAPLHLQLSCIHAPTSSAQTQAKSLAKMLGSLILVHLLAPLASIPIMFAGWIVAIFWALSALVADEGGRNGDGKMLAVTLADWWIWWLEGRAFR